MNKPVRENELEWNQFCRLGEMMGDGLHHEADGKWISKEYRRLSRLLIPEIKDRDKAMRKAKADNIDKKIAKLIEIKRCEKDGGQLVQKRSGTKLVYCQTCNTRYVAQSKK